LQALFHPRNILSLSSSIPLHTSSLTIICFTDNGPISHVTHDTCRQSGLNIRVAFLQCFQICSDQVLQFVLVHASACLPCRGHILTPVLKCKTLFCT
jgi:hypothetical protein